MVLPGVLHIVNGVFVYELVTYCFFKDIQNEENLKIYHIEKRLYF